MSRRVDIIADWDRFEALNDDELRIIGKAPTAPNEYPTDLRNVYKKKETVFRRNTVRCTASETIERRAFFNFQDEDDEVKDSVIEAQLEEFGRLIPQREKFIEQMERVAAGIEDEDLDDEEIEEIEEDEAEWLKEWSDCMKSIENDIDAGKFNFDFSNKNSNDKPNKTLSRNVDRSHVVNSLFDATIGRNMVVPSNLRFTSTASSTIGIITRQKTNKKDTVVKKVAVARNDKANSTVAKNQVKKPQATKTPRKFSCQDCSSQFVSNSNLQFHIRKFHTKQTEKDTSKKTRSYKCPYDRCHSRFVHYSSKKHHIELYHQSQKNPTTAPKKVQSKSEKKKKAGNSKRLKGDNERSNTIPAIIHSERRCAEVANRKIAEMKTRWM